MRERCFNCLRVGHSKKECTFDTVCIRCGVEGHGSRACTLPRSEVPEDELRRRVLAMLDRQGRSNMRRRAAEPLPARRNMAPRHGAGDLGSVLHRQGSPSSSPAGSEEDRRMVAVAGPALDSEALLCVIRRSRGLEDMERRLRFALVAYIGGGRPEVSCEEVAVELFRAHGLSGNEVSVHRFLPEDFLLVFSSAEARNRVGARFDSGRFSLHLRPWIKQAQATQMTMRSKVDLVIEGIPPHAWDLEVVEEVLGTSCVVTALAPESRSRSDMSLFRLSAWTSQLEGIPTARMLAIPEPPLLDEEAPPSPAREFSGEDLGSPPAPARGTEELRLLKYKVLIHVERVEEESVPEDDWVFSQTSDNAQSGLPEPDAGSDGRRRCVTRSLPWCRGVADQRGPTSNGVVGGAGGRTYCQVAEGRLDWQLPPIVDRTVGKEGVQLDAPRNKTKSIQIDRRVRAGGETLVADPSQKDSLLAVEAPRMTVVQFSMEDGETRQTGAEKAPLPEAEGAALVEKSGLVGPDTDTLGNLPSGDKVGPSGASGLAPTHPPQSLGLEASLDPEADTQRIGHTGLSVAETEQVGLTGSSVAECMGMVVANADPGASNVDGTAPSVPGHVETGCDQRAATGPPLLGGLEPATLLVQEEWVCDVRVENLVMDDGRLQEAQRQVSEAPLALTNSEVDSAPEDLGMTDREAAAYGRIKRFCTNVLKMLAPPLLQEVESSSKLCPDAEPFTPKCFTRSSGAKPLAGKPPKKASTPECVLLKTLGIAQEDLVVDEEALNDLKAMFDSPLREQHLRAITAIFGKVVPPELLLLGNIGDAIAVQ
ncbi:unnamed protein product [Alopecurus aequalis]